jgi:hypothetical protein
MNFMRYIGTFERGHFRYNETLKIGLSGAMRQYGLEKRTVNAIISGKVGSISH